MLTQLFYIWIFVWWWWCVNIQISETQQGRTVMFTKRELRIKDVYCVILQDHDDDGDHNDELDTYYDEDVAPRYI